MNLRSLFTALLAARTTSRLVKRAIPNTTRRRRASRNQMANWRHRLVLAAFLGFAAFVGFRGLHWNPPLAPSVNDQGDGGNSGAAWGDTRPQYSPVATGQASPDRTIIIGSFNIQTFGRATLSNPSVMGILVDIARRFDLLAIQELRSTEQHIVPQFVEMINADGSSFRYIVGPRQGYTISKEQYVYLYDARKLAPVSPPYVSHDASGKFHRAPLVGHFRSIELPPEEAFTFVVLNVHTDPDEIRFEIPELKTILERVRQENPHEDDFIVLGDLNAPPSYFLDQGWFAWPHAAIDDQWTTNVRETKNYDNIVFDRQATREFTGRRSVFNFRRAYQLELNEALQVSDHFPVWAEFSIAEVRAVPHQSSIQGQVSPALPR